VLVAMSVGAASLALGAACVVDAGGLTGGDAGTREDASDAGAVDAPSACDAGFCACLSPPPTFCDDFDHGTLGARWTAPVANPMPGASLTLDSNAVSSPNALRVIFPRSAGGGAIALAEEFSQTFQEARLEFDVFAPDGFTDDQVAAFRIGGSYTVSLVFLSDGAKAFEEPSEVPTSLGAPSPPAGVWTHVTLIFRLPGSGPGLFRLSYGNPDAGAAVYDLPIRTAVSGTLRLAFGGVYVQDSPNGWTSNFDDVVLRLY
jgi:hypothetical protein